MWAVRRSATASSSRIQSGGSRCGRARQDSAARPTIFSATSVAEFVKLWPVESLAAPDCVLFLWTTASLLPRALEAMEAWGFDYKSHFIWAKDRWGTGDWNRSQHELLLVGTKGDVPAPAPGTQLSSLINAPVGRYAEKPEIFYELIESHFPNLPKIELNAHGARAGWDRWGPEALAAADA